MPAERKVQQVQELERFLGGASIVIGTNYAGLTVAQMEALRRALKQGGVDYRVVKNRLALRAAEHLDRPHLANILQGPVGLVVGRGDPVGSVRTLASYLRSSRVSMLLTGAIMDGHVLTAAEVEALATMPPRPVLLGQVLGSMQGVLVGLVTVLNAHMSGLMTVLEQRRVQLEERS